MGTSRRGEWGARRLAQAQRCWCDVESQQDAARLFAARQVDRIDEGDGLSEPWHVYGIGRFLELT